MIFWPASSRSAPIDVEIVDYSATGIGITHADNLPPGQKFVVREPFVTSGSTCIYTVVRSDPRKDGTYSIGLHIGNTVEDESTAATEEPKLARGWAFLYLLFALTGAVLVVSAVLIGRLRSLHGG